MLKCFRSRVIGDNAILPICSVRHVFKHRPLGPAYVRTRVCITFAHLRAHATCSSFKKISSICDDHYPLPRLSAMVGNGRLEYSCLLLHSVYCDTPSNDSLCNYTAEGFALECLIMQVFRSRLPAFVDKMDNKNGMFKL